MAERKRHGQRQMYGFERLPHLTSTPSPPRSCPPRTRGCQAVVDSLGTVHLSQPLTEGLQLHSSLFACLPVTCQRSTAPVAIGTYGPRTSWCLAVTDTYWAPIAMHTSVTGSHSTDLLPTPHDRLGTKPAPVQWWVLIGCRTLGTKLHECLECSILVGRQLSRRTVPSISHDLH